MMEVKIVQGPAVIGNTFGYYGKEVPQGKFVLAIEGEYVNGGYGPIQLGGPFRHIFHSVKGPFECPTAPREGRYYRLYFGGGKQDYVIASEFADSERERAAFEAVHNSETA